MHDFALGIIKAIRASRLPIRVKNAYPAQRVSRPGGYLGPKVLRVAANDAKYRAILAAVEAHPEPLPFGFIAKRCRCEGITPANFYAWRYHHLKARAEVSTGDA